MQAEAPITVGILGGGQLGLMLALAGRRLGIRCKVFDPSGDAPARQSADLTIGNYEDAAAIAAFCRDLSVLTYEFENVPEAALREVPGNVPVYPPPAALAVSQER